MATAKLSIDIEARLANFERDLNKISKSAEGMAGKLKSSFSGITTILGATVGALAAAGAAGQFKDLINELDDLSKKAQQVGMSVEDLSALKFAGGMSGVEFDEITTSLGKLSAKMQDAAAGSKEAQAVFADLGISVVNSSGQLKNADEVFAEIADKFSGIRDGAGKTALAMDLFGKSGAKLIPLLNGGTAGLADMRAEAEQLGGVISEKLAKQSEQFNDNLDRLATLAGAAGKSMASGLLPWLNEVAESFLISRKNADSLWEALNRPIAGLGIFSAYEKLKDSQRALTDLETKRAGLMNEGLATKAVDSEIASVKRSIEYYKELQRTQALANSGDNYGNEGRGLSESTNLTDIVRSKSGGASSGKKSGEISYWDEVVRLTKEANEELEKREKLDEALTKEARYWKDLIDPTAQYVRQLEEIQKLVDAGKLTSAEGLEAQFRVQEKMGEAVSKTTTEIEKQKSIVEELGLTFSSAFEDAVVGGGKFSDVLKGLEQDILRLLARKAVTEPLAKAVSSVNWGSMLSGLFGTTANAKGNVYDMPSLAAYSGTVVTQPTFFANGGNVMGEAGPEGIFPLKRGADGKLGVSAEGVGGANVTVNVINNGDNQARTERRSDGQGGSIIDVIVERTKASLAGDIGRGSGPLPAVLEGTYGLSRSAGAY